MCGSFSNRRLLITTHIAGPQEFQKVMLFLNLNFSYFYFDGLQECPKELRTRMPKIYYSLDLIL